MLGIVPLLKSRKFWTLMIDTIISLTLYFISRFSPQALEDVKFVIVSIQPVFIMLIGAIAYEDASESKAGIVR